VRIWKAAPDRHASRADGEEGFALLTVVGTMSLLLLLVLAATTFAMRSVPTSRRAQDYAAAMAAAQAGVDDYLSRLNTCDTFWAAACAGSAPETAKEPNWAEVPGSEGPTKATYTYSIMSTPATTPGLIRVKATGKVNGVQRSIVVDLRKKGFLEFIYYTDKESRSPAIVMETDARVTQEQANECARYYYSAGGVDGRTAGSDADDAAIAGRCDISFIGGDVINGPLYTKDAMLLRANNGVGPRFNGPVETYWLTSYTPAPDPAAPYRKGTAGVVPHPDGKYGPTIATRLLELPPTNTAIRAQADPATSTQGCLYKGSTRIVLKSSGKMDVTSATTAAQTNPGCGPGTNLDLPENGVIYVDPSTGTCPAGWNNKAAGLYPVAGDVTSYNCLAGDVFVQGTLNGQLTIASANNIIVTDDVSYAQQVWNGTSIQSGVDDVLGLVAQGFVKVYHPIDGDGRELARTQVSDLEIDAAILSVDNSFTVQNYNRGSTLGQLRIRGGIYQRHRGPVGTSNNGAAVTGYLKDYVYDSRLVSLPPPHFLEPASAPWQVVGLSE
jgi:hypothetical protein